MTRCLQLMGIVVLLCSFCMATPAPPTTKTPTTTSKSKPTTATTTKQTTHVHPTTKATTTATTKKQSSTTSTTTQSTTASTTTQSPTASTTTQSTTTSTTTQSTTASTTTQSTTASTTTQSTTSSTSTQSSSPSSSTSTTPASQNISKPLESNDLAVAASGHKSPKRAVPGFNENFYTCKRNSLDFDKCIRDGLNNVREFIPRGVSEYNIPSFDPIYIKEVLLKRGGPAFGYRLKLKNVRESGWRLSEVTKFKSNLRLNTVQLTQYFPDKYLEGEYEFESLILTPSFNKGRFNLSLYELNQTTTLIKPRNSKSIKVNVDVQEIGDMKLHISNLLRGRTVMENLLDRMINSAAWRPGFVIVRPFVNELVSTAFTDIYNRVFNNFDFNEIIPLL